MSKKSYNTEKISMSHFADAINHSKIGDLNALTKGNWITKIITTLVLIILLILFLKM